PPSRSRSIPCRARSMHDLCRPLYRQQTWLASSAHQHSAIETSELCTPLWRRLRRPRVEAAFAVRDRRKLEKGKALMAPDSQQAPDPGLAALVMMLQFQGVAADAVQIRHRLSTPAIGVPDMLRCAKDYGLKASTFATKWSRLARTPLPALAVLK